MAELPPAASVEADGGGGDDNKKKKTSVAELDAQLDALLRRHMGMGSEEYISAMGLRAFHPSPQVCLPPFVYDAGEFILRVREKQRSLRATLKEAFLLKENLDKLKAHMSNIENTLFAQGSNAAYAGSGSALCDRSEIERLTTAIAQRHNTIATLRYDIWRLTSPAHTRVIDVDAFHLELQALLGQRITAAMAERHAMALDICADRASKRELGQ